MKEEQDRDAQARAASVSSCALCGAGLKKLLVCSQCKAAAYCSKECQVRDWKAGHKEECVEEKNSKLRAEVDAQHEVQMKSLETGKNETNAFGSAMLGVRFANEFAQMYNRALAKDIEIEAENLQEKLETFCKQGEYGAIKDLQQEVFEKYRRFRRAAPEASILIMQNFAVLAFNYGEELKRSGDVLEAIKAFELNLQCGRNVEGDFDADTFWPCDDRLLQEHLSTKRIAECYRELGDHDLAKTYLGKWVEVIQKAVEGTPKGGRSKLSWLIDLGKCHESIADLSSDATERDASLEKAICALTEAKSLALAEVVQANPESSGLASMWEYMDVAHDLGRCLFARAFLQKNDEDGHAAPAHLQLKANLETATQDGCRMTHYVKPILWQQARLTFKMSRNVDADIKAFVSLICWCREQSLSAYALCGYCGKLRAEPDASQVPSEERTKRQELATSAGLPFRVCYDKNDTLAPMSACSGCMTLRSVSPFLHPLPYLIRCRAVRSYCNHAYLFLCLRDFRQVLFAFMPSEGMEGQKGGRLHLFHCCKRSRSQADLPSHQGFGRPSHSGNLVFLLGGVTMRLGSISRETVDRSCCRSKSREVGLGNR